eukprot:NODE_9592_length_635_cov_74.095703_g9326_i0.p1 GENE.NODE_9592_length_635_cov_74.095703_g9326_i0~~NODE_9592_length_635_cov_74.095703_g9326_i0.p1  ORF type:complete len:180 (-),score=16.07 NODE_9592_length_635_cov_74.095703_g9326_i0:5-544(-)
MEIPESGSDVPLSRGSSIDKPLAAYQQQLSPLNRHASLDQHIALQNQFHHTNFARHSSFEPHLLQQQGAPLSRHSSQDQYAHVNHSSSPPPYEQPDPYAQQPSSRPPKSAWQPPEGSWKCSSCSNYNFPQRTTCNRCRLPRLPFEGSPQGGDAASSGQLNQLLQLAQQLPPHVLSRTLR